MSEYPTATPEPVPWGDEACPFPPGTVVDWPDMAHDVPYTYHHKSRLTTEPLSEETRREAAAHRVYFDGGIPFLPKEIQGMINAGKMEIVGYEPPEDGENA